MCRAPPRPPLVVSASSKTNQRRLMKLRANCDFIVFIPRPDLALFHRFFSGFSASPRVSAKRYALFWNGVAFRGYEETVTVDFRRFPGNLRLYALFTVGSLMFDDVKLRLWARNSKMRNRQNSNTPMYDRCIDLIDLINWKTSVEFISNAWPRMRSLQ